MKKQIVLICLFAIISTFIFPFSGLAKSESMFKDVSTDHWAYHSIQRMYDAHIIPVKKKGVYYPNEQITRAEAAQYIYNALNIEKAQLKNFRFEDVPHKATYSDAVYTLTAIDVIYPAKRFNPNAKVTRAEWSKMVSIAFQIEVDDINYSTFKDVPSTHWAKIYIESLADINIIKGTKVNYFSPQTSITRAQAAVMIDRIFNFQQKLASNEIIYDFLQKHYIHTENEYPSWTKKVVELVNIERNKQGIPPVNEDVKLTQLAVIKGNDFSIKNYFDHYSPLYGYPWDMAGIFDYSFTSFGENIARNFTTPESVVYAWMQSTSHRTNILNPAFTNIGIACTNGNDGQLYWVQLFSSN